MAVDQVSFATDYDGAAAGVPLACQFTADSASEVFLATLEIGGTEFVNVDLADYTVTDLGGGVFEVTPDLTYAAGITVRVFRWMDYTQPFQFSDNGALPAARIEAMGDRLCELLQQIRGELGLDVAAVTLPPGATFVNATTTFADSAARGNATPAFLGQVGVQLNTGDTYRGSSIAAGGWTLIVASGGGTYTAGNGLTLTASEFTIDTAITLDMDTVQGPITGKSFSTVIIQAIATEDGFALSFPASGGTPVNYFAMAQSLTGDPISISAVGTDADIDIDIVPKGTGAATVNSDPIVTEAATQALTGKSVNGVTLDATGAATEYLDRSGAYSTPAGGTGNTVVFANAAARAALAPTFEGQLGMQIDTNVVYKAIGTGAGDWESILLNTVDLTTPQNVENKFLIKAAHDYLAVLQQNLVDAATVDWDMYLGGDATIVLGGNRTMAAPTNAINGGMYVLHVVQSAGSNTLTWNAAYVFPSGVAPTLTTTAGRCDTFLFVRKTNKMLCIGQTLNLTL